MNIAVVLYGQPRNYLQCYNKLMIFLQSQKHCTFDFFYHCWVLNENESYTHATWRNISKKDVLYNTNTIADLQKLYNPISHEYENQNTVKFDSSLYSNTIAYKNTTGKKLSNTQNVLYQMYSRNKARNLLNAYLEKIDNKNYYDFTLFLRFDLNIMPNVQFTTINKNKVYVSNIHVPRKIIPDHCIIAPTHIFLQWFTIYDNLKDIIDNTQLLEDIRKLKEDIDINAEEVIFAKYIYHYKNADNILYFQGGVI
jgi:hypothetical protein